MVNSTPAAEPLATIDDEVRIEHRLFTLQDWGDGVHASAGELPVPYDLLSAGLGGALFNSGGNDHYAAVRLELWATEPQPNAAPTWEAVEEGVATLVAGQVRLRSIFGDMTPHLLPLPTPGRYGIRAYCTGRQAAFEHPTNELFFHGIERWLVQLWPIERLDQDSSNARHIDHDS